MNSSNISLNKSINNINSQNSINKYYLDILFESCDDASFSNFYNKLKSKDLNNNEIDRIIWNKLLNINEHLKMICTSSFESKLDLYSSYNVVELLNNKSPKINTYKPSNIKVHLKEHQRSTVYAMACKELNNIIRIRAERSFRSGMLRREIKYTTSLNIGILADDVGSGKTLNILSLIAICPISIPYFDRKYNCIKEICKKFIREEEKNIKQKLSDTICYDILNIIQAYFTKSIEYSNIIPNNDNIESYTKITEVNLTKEYIPSNLIIVPHSLFHQWLNDIQNMTNLKVYPIKTKRDKIDIEIFKKYDIVLCNANKYNNIAKKSSKYKWSRIIIDEADTINLPNSMAISCDFLWFITTTFERLEEHKNIGFIKNTFRNLEYNCTYTIYKALKNALVIKTNNEVVKDSFTGSIPIPVYNIVKCSAPLWMYLIKDCIGKTLLEKLNAGDIVGGITYLKSNSFTYDFKNMNIIQYLILRLRRQINNHSKRINSLNKQIDDLTTTSKYISHKSFNQNITSLKKKINRYSNNKINKENRLDHLKENLSLHSLCCLCQQQIVDKQSTTLCCDTKFCKYCLDKHLKQYGKCPYCLQQIKYNFVNISEIERNWIDNTITKYNSKENDKIHNLIKIIQNNPNGKFLIFSNYSFNQIINFLDRKKITWKKLCGRPDIIKKLVNNYDKGIIKVLMLNAKYYGNGLNLQMTTDIIIFHKMDKNTKTQIIGRAQRVGRKYKLKIYELEYEHEHESEHEHEYET